MKPIRTLFLSTTLALGGAERVVEQLATRLDRRRFDVEVLTLRSPGRVGESIAAAGVAVHHDRTGPQRLDPLLVPRLRSFLRAGAYEILYFLDHPHAIFHGMLASAASPARVRVMPVHTTGRWGGADSVPRSVRFFLPWLDAVVAIADAQRTYLIDREGIPARKIAVIPNGIPAELPDPPARALRRREVREELGIPPEAKVAMILAVLRPEKNHELLLEAVARLRGRFPDLVLLVAGDGPRREFLERQAAGLGLEGRVRFLGHRPDGRRLWAAADLAVLCSHPRVETLPLSLLEAMDAGLPVVATDVGALREMVEPGASGILTPPGQVEPLAEAVGALLADPGRSERFGARSQEIVAARFRVERMVEETERLLERLLARQGSGPLVCPCAVC